MIEPIAELIGLNGHSLQNEFVAHDLGKRTDQADLAFTEGFDFGTTQLNTGLEAFEDMVIVKRLTIGGYI